MSFSTLRAQVIELIEQSAMPPSTSSVFALINDGPGGSLTSAQLSVFLRSLQEASTLNRKSGELNDTIWTQDPQQPLVFYTASHHPDYVQQSQFKVLMLSAAKHTESECKLEPGTIVRCLRSMLMHIASATPAPATK